jgi:hypothetical protein
MTNCAKTLGLPDLDEHSQYCAGAIQEGIEQLIEKIK